jgi:hypothetical protein
MAVHGPEILFSQNTEGKRIEAAPQRDPRSLVPALNQKLVPGEHEPPCRFLLVKALLVGGDKSHR